MESKFKRVRTVPLYAATFGASLLAVRHWYAEEEDGSEAADESDDSASEDLNGGKVKFTPEQQAEIDKLLGARALRAKDSTTKKLLKSFGAESSDELAEMLSEYRRIKEEGMTEAERIKNQLDQTKSTLDEKSSELSSLREKHTTALKRNAVLSQLNKDGSGISGDAVTTALQLIDFSSIKVSDDEEVIGVDDAIKELLKQHPILKSQSGNGGGLGTPPSSKTRFQSPGPDPKDLGKIEEKPLFKL